jgi:hypothetical protein
MPLTYTRDQSGNEDEGGRILELAHRATVTGLPKTLEYNDVDPQIHLLLCVFNHRASHPNEQPVKVSGGG